MMPQKHLKLVVSLSVIVAVVLGFAGRQWFAQRRDWDRKLTLIAGEIKPGTSKPELKAFLGSYRKEVPAKLIISDDQSTWYVMNPNRFGAQERVLTLEFDAKGSLMHRRLRTADSESILPEGAPQDF